MRAAWLNWHASRRDAGSTRRKARRLRTFVQGGLASVLAVAGLVVFATEASAHNNFFQSVSGACNSAPTFGAGATVTWTLYNDWNQSETGTLSTSQGTLSTAALSIAASPTQNATPPAALSQTFTQTLSAAQLAALTPSSTISVSWSATWTDGTHQTGTLSTTPAKLGLTTGCVSPKTTPTIATTLVPPSSPTISNSWGDSATVTGSAGGAAPAGSVSFHVCQASASPSSSSTCATGGSLVGTVESPTTSGGNASTYNLATTYTPPSVGTFCFYAVYAPTASESYLTASGPAECFSVGAAASSITTQQSTSASGSGSVTMGGTVTDTATVTGNSTGGAPGGTVTFTVCGPMAGNATCSSGSPVGSSPATLTPVASSDTSTAASVSFMPTAVGTYCFAAVYNPAPGSSYVTSSDNVSGTAQASECFSVSAPNFTVVKTDVPTSGTSVAPGSTIAYTVAVKNVGDGAGSATVTDAVPSSLTVKGTPACAVTSPDTCSVSNPSGSTWTFTVSLAAGDSATVTFSATVASNATGSITNTATITTGPCTTAAGCSSSVTNPIITTAAAVVTPSTPTTPTPATTATTTPPKTSPATIAFTGALLSQEWMAGLAALILGSGLVLLARWRRRSPKHAASK
jgi:fimbrial isopeptide formation D2 family protein